MQFLYVAVHQRVFSELIAKDSILSEQELLNLEKLNN